jgi:hypothetical protein
LVPANAESGYDNMRMKSITSEKVETINDESPRLYVEVVGSPSKRPLLITDTILLALLWYGDAYHSLNNDYN